ncbi:hypothetical protein R9X47_00835 [Wukongibacter baidiensis]|uniref:hypothetical protein n=1 Tax=Wukongibacter baidiensis TaxID=1723361 RepID=UPI003D7FD965
MEKILLGFPSSKNIVDIIERFTFEFNKKGVNVQITQMSSLREIEESLLCGDDYTILILEDHLDDKKQARPQYFSKLIKENPQLRIIYLISESYHKSTYLESIYESKAYNCLFKKDGSIENIVYISLNPRNRIEAKSYYGFGSNTDDYIEDHRNFVSMSEKTYKNRIKNRGVIIKEKIVYKAPKDYQKIIGIYSPYAAGKTVIASNLAKYYTKMKLEVTLIDTDYHKKDLLYHFPLDDDDYFKMSNFYKDIAMGKEIYEIDSYAIEIGSRLKLFTDHRDSQYEITFEMLNYIARSCESNLIIIDIASYLEPELVNQILSLCDERVIISDKMISTLNGLPYKLRLQKYNMKNLSLVINRDLNVKGLSKNRIVSYFRDIEFSEEEIYSFEFNNVFFIPNKFELIAESMANRDVALGKDKEFDESIMRIANSLYQTSMKSKDKGVKGLLKMLRR